MRARTDSNRCPRWMIVRPAQIKDPFGGGPRRKSTAILAEKGLLNVRPTGLEAAVYGLGVISCDFRRENTDSSKLVG